MTTMPPPHAPQPATSTGPGVVAAGWLAGESTFGPEDQHWTRRLMGASGVSFLIHGLMFLFVLYLLAVKPATTLLTPEQPPVKVVYLDQPGPGGGGGGSPAPAPPKQLEIAHHATPAPVPVITPPEPVKVEPPKPELNAPVETNMANIMQASGVSSVSIAGPGGGGSGGGLGAGKGDGVGEGTGGGFGGGAFAPGNGITTPIPILQREPKYTSDAMRAKVQGEVWVEAVVLPNGTVGDARVVRSLDKAYGLDQEALKAAKLWLFKPGKDKAGNPVPVKVTLILEFRLH